MLQPGYNLVTESVAETESELAALEFFRRVAANEDVETPVSVTGLTDLLYDSAEDEREAILGDLRQTLRKSRSLGSMDAVQFILDGRFVDDLEFRVRIERSGDGIYLDIGQMFVEEPQPMSATHAVARK
ncbi:hypothetical protein NDI76_02135 [Halogeometricum sp. S1BR25-6]|uniref:DUF8076 domain-containing protein n=1 Tax=Halogeometricum salsisoli TaxID=2950536 RepID=A0ABU2G9T0_9EURY|nr:hypothetical protein [Halogeometricum sp. S1BR25-6]MDS0297540.1 hypothetical protein [Halogeometricum sp. S1BR25-6]